MSPAAHRQERQAHMGVLQLCMRLAMSASASCVQSGSTTSPGPPSANRAAAAGFSLRLAHTALASRTCQPGCTSAAQICLVTTPPPQHSPLSSPASQTSPCSGGRKGAWPSYSPSLVSQTSMEATSSCMYSSLGAHMARVACHTAAWPCRPCPRAATNRGRTLMMSGRPVRDSMSSTNSTSSWMHMSTRGATRCTGLGPCLGSREGSHTTLLFSCSACTAGYCGGEACGVQQQRGGVCMSFLQQIWQLLCA